MSYFLRMIAAARDAVPALVATVRDRDAEVTRLRALVEAAYREGRDEDSPDHPDVDRDWAVSGARKELEAL